MINKCNLTFGLRAGVGGIKLKFKKLQLGYSFLKKGIMDQK